jgi:hypothetical protein
MLVFIASQIGIAAEVFASVIGSKSGQIKDGRTGGRRGDILGLG